MISPDGEKSLNLTDRDMQLLSEKACKIKANTKKIDDSTSKSSFFKPCDSQNGYPDKIYVYGFENARHLSKILDDMWTYQGKEELKSLAPNCVASIYKYYDVSSRREIKSEISPFIYEF